MVRGAGMSRGCATCRQRKIKCDESQPECARCSRSGRKCPGSVVGAVFLACNGHDSMKSKRIEHEHRDVRARRQSMKEDDLSAGIQEVFSNTAPDPSDLFEMQLRASFISFFIRSRANKTHSQPWLEYYLLEANSVNVPGWRESVLAATLALYGSIEENPGAIAASYKWYGHALGFQRRNLRVYTENPYAQVNEMNVSMAVILAYSEVVLPTHPRAFSQHIKAAAALLHIVGPEACIEGSLHQMFLTVRIYMVYESFSERTTSFFASSEWIRVPFQTRQKRLLDLVVDLLLQISRYVASPRTAVSLLKELWHQLVQNNPDLTSSPQYDMLEQAPEVRDLLACVPDQMTHSNSESAIAFALYSFGWVVSLSLLNQSGNHTTKYAEVINGHCETILDAAAFVSTIQDGCSYIRMAPPLRTVSYYSSNPRQREKGIVFLRVWGKSINLLQMSAVALGQSWRDHKSYYLM